MVYINSDGSIGGRPWFKQASIFFWGIINFISTFFRTLFNPALKGNGKANEYDNTYKRPGGGPPRPPRTSRFATISSCQSPIPGGG